MTVSEPSAAAFHRSAGKSHVDRLAQTARPAGSELEREAQRYCRGVLEPLGFTVATEEFSFSEFPGRYATPVAGIFSIVVLATVAWLGYAGRAPLALTLLVVAALVLALLAMVITVRGVLGINAFRRRSGNLVASRGEPALWLMAHSDTKSQPVSMAVRVAGIVGSGLVWILAGLLGVAATFVGVSDDWRTAGWTVIGVAGVLAGLPVAASLVGDRSPGAFDNASGVATVLVAATLLPANIPLGVVITSGEELGLAGARAWVRERKPGVAINVDGVDDTGVLTAMTTRRGSVRLASLFARQATSAGIAHRTIRLVPGILADSVALADAGWESITVSHGTLGSLRRIHTAGDTADRITGDGIARAATVVAGMVTELT